MNITREGEDLENLLKKEEQEIISNLKSINNLDVSKIKSYLYSNGIRYFTISEQSVNFKIKTLVSEYLIKK